MLDQLSVAELTKYILAKSACHEMTGEKLERCGKVVAS